MTPQDRIDTGFAPWSLMTPDPAKARATRPEVQTAQASSRVHEDKRAPEMAADDGYMFGEDGLTFGDLLDIVNPLQHLPVVGAVYRSITGDEASPGAKMAGGAIYGGPIGFASAMINNAIEETTGDDVMGHMLAMVGLGDDGEVPADPTTLADAGNTAEAGIPAATGAGPALPPGTVPIGAEAELAVQALAMNAPAGGPAPSAGNGAATALNPAQAAFLERLAGNPAPTEADAEPLDAMLTGAQTAAAKAETGQSNRKDFGGAARISKEMAQHLAMLAQAGSPGQILAQQAQAGAQNPATGQAPGTAAARAAGQADMRAASAKYSAALPVSINGSAPAANPFAAIEAKQNQPDPFETAMNRLGLNPPTVKTRGGEDTQSKVMEAAFGPGQSQTANLAQAAGITPPPGEAVPSAMLDALNRYQAMKQQG